MARSAVQLQEDENYYFHINYGYMWKKLNTAPYYVSGSGATPSWIREPWQLPSYVNLSRCMNPEFVPSLNIVNKIICFYNANLKPEVDAYRFLHEKLELSDGAGAEKTDADPFCGLYRCLYFAGNRNRRSMSGGLMRISRVRDVTAVQMIAGLTDEADFENPALLKLFEKQDITLEAYKEYRAGLEISRRRTSLCKGTAELSPGMMHLELGVMDHDGAALLVRCAAGAEEKFLGSIGLAALLDRQEMQMFKMGFVRADIAGIRPLKLNDEEAARLLEMEKFPNEHVCLSFREAADWNDLILNSAE